MDNIYERDPDSSYLVSDGLLFFVCFIVTRTPLCRYKGQLYDPLDKCSDSLLALQVPQEGRGLGSM